MKIPTPRRNHHPSVIVNLRTSRKISELSAENELLTAENIKLRAEVKRLADNLAEKSGYISKVWMVLGDIPGAVSALRGI